VASETTDVTGKRGLIWVEEKIRETDAYAYQSRATGSRSAVATQRSQVPALLYTKLNSRQNDFVKFDAIEGRVLIDRKLSVTGFKKQKDDLVRMHRALAQNASLGFSGVIELPTRGEVRKVRRMLSRLGANKHLKVRLAK
jgi:filamentous hemagglutinin